MADSISAINGPERRLQNEYSVPPAVRAQVEQRYKQWKRARVDDASQIDTLSSFYTPDALIYQWPNGRVSPESFCNLVVEMHETGLYESINDREPPQWAQNESGDQVELLVHQNCGHAGGDWTLGERHIKWERSGTIWQIVSDDFIPRQSSSSEEVVIGNAHAARRNSHSTG